MTATIILVIGGFLPLVSSLISDFLEHKGYKINKFAFNSIAFLGGLLALYGTILLNSESDNANKKLIQANKKVDSLTNLIFSISKDNSFKIDQNLDKLEHIISESSQLSQKIKEERKAISSLHLDTKKAKYPLPSSVFLSLQLSFQVDSVSQLEVDSIFFSKYNIKDFNLGGMRSVNSNDFNKLLLLDWLDDGLTVGFYEIAKNDDNGGFIYGNPVLTLVKTRNLNTRNHFNGALLYSPQTKKFGIIYDNIVLNSMKELIFLNTKKNNYLPNSILDLEKSTILISFHPFQYRKFEIGTIQIQSPELNLLIRDIEKTNSSWLFMKKMSEIQ